MKFFVIFFSVLTIIIAFPPKKDVENKAKQMSPPISLEKNFKEPPSTPSAEESNVERFTSLEIRENEPSISTTPKELLVGGATEKSHQRISKTVHRRNKKKSKKKLKIALSELAYDTSSPETPHNKELEENKEIDPSERQVSVVPLQDEIRNTNTSEEGKEIYQHSQSSPRSGEIVQRNPENPQSPKIPQTQEISQPQETTSQGSSRSNESETSPINRAARRKLRKKKNMEEFHESLANVMFSNFTPYVQKIDRASGSSSQIDDRDEEDETPESRDITPDVVEALPGPEIVRLPPEDESEQSNWSEAITQEETRVSNSPSPKFEFAVGTHTIQIRSHNNDQEIVPENIKVNRPTDDASSSDNNFIQMPNSMWFLKCPSKEIADDLRYIISEFQELYDESTNSNLHVVSIRNIPQDVKERNLKYSMIEQYDEAPKGIKLIAPGIAHKSDLKIALLQVDDSLLEKIKDSSGIHVLQSQLTIDICLVIKGGDELFTPHMEVSTTSTTRDSGNSRHLEAGEKTRSANPNAEKQVISQKEIMVESADLKGINIINFLSDNRLSAEKWRAKLAEWDSIEQMLNTSEEVLSSDVNRNKRMIILHRVSTEHVLVFEELQDVISNPGVFGVNSTTLFVASNVALIDCNLEVGAKRLQKAIENSSQKLLVKPIKFFRYEFWIHDIPLDVTVDEIFENIRRRYGENPVSVRFINYRNTPNASIKLANAYASETLLRQIRKSPHFQIRRREERINCFIQIQRCSNCRLFGHRTEMCPLPIGSAL